jgi:N-acetylmuramoyl-L-alanine amidase
LTREGDRFLANEERAEYANACGADLLISIHCNGWFDPGLRGFCVGVLPSPRPGGVAEKSELPRWGKRSRQTVRDTELLAETILEELDKELALPNRGIQYAEYAALAGATMPAVLIECGFLTHPQEAAMLSDPGFHEGIASAIAFAVLRYRDALALSEGE